MLIVLATLLLGCSAQDPHVPRSARTTRDSYEFRWSEPQSDGPPPDSYPNIANLLEARKPILQLYREDVTHEAVTEFFREVAGSDRIALPILYYADRRDLSLSLVFSLVWVESRFDPVALNRNPRSIDRGLFQLNSSSFPRLGTEDFFDPQVNAHHGTSYLRFALNQGKDWETALAVYNAGLTRVRANRIPPSTQEYVRKVARYKARLERRFMDYISSRFPLPAM